MTFLRRRRANSTSMSAEGITDVGVVRSTNEDNFAVRLGEEAPLGEAVLAVADGMGGHAAGEVASQISLDALIDALSKTSSPSEQSLHRAVDAANRRVYSASRLGDLQGMGTTLVAALLAGGVLLICNVGDSRAYLLREGKLTQLTRDHSWVGDMVAKGLLTPEQASVHPHRNMLTRALGVGEFVQVDVTRVVLRKGDRILLCSDGLYGQVSHGAIESILQGQSLRRAASELVRSAKRAGGDDNITVIVAQMDSAVQAVPVQSENVDDSLDVTLAPGRRRPQSASRAPDSQPALEVGGGSEPPRRNLLPLFAVGGFGAMIVILLIVFMAWPSDGDDTRPAVSPPVMATSTPTAATSTPTAVPTHTPTSTPSLTTSPTAVPTLSPTAVPADDIPATLIATETPIPTASPTAKTPPAATTTSTSTDSSADTPTPTATSTSSTQTPMSTSTSVAGRITFVSDRNENQNIYVMNADGSGEPSRLTNNSADDQDPSWVARERERS